MVWSSDIDGSEAGSGVDIYTDMQATLAKANESQSAN